MLTIEIKVEEQVSARERLGNSKPWFNGVHFFSYIKLIELIDIVPPLD